jgi:hypothetical protein
MRLLALVIVIGCTSSHSPVTDRTDCNTCHTTPALADPPPGACMVTDHATYASTCFQCHGTTSWCPADARHTKFDLMSTSHAGWDCADCHIAITYDPPAVTDPAQINCTNCHWHDRAQTDPHHVGKSDYTYGPATCIASECHGDRRQ